MLELARTRAAFAAKQEGEVAVSKASLVPPFPPRATQLQHLLLREARICMRDTALAPWHFGSALLSGLLLAATYYHLPHDLVGVISRLGLMFAIQCLLGMQSLQSLMSWRDGHTGFVREQSAGYYFTLPFVLAKVAVDFLFLRVGPPLLFGLILYPVAGLHEGRIMVFLQAIILTSASSSSFCLAMGSLSPRSAIGLPLAVLMILIFLLFGGVMLAGAPSWVGWVSFYHTSYRMLAANELTNASFRFNPKGVDKEFDAIPGEEWMRLLNLDTKSNTENVTILIGWIIFFTACSWVALAVSQRFRR